MRSKRGGTRSNCGAKTPHTPCAFLRNAPGEERVAGNAGSQVETTACRYGSFYWCVKTPLSASGEIYVHADGVAITDGCLVLAGPGEHGVNMIFGPGQWQACFAASCLDGHAVAVEHWPGEVLR